MEDNKIIEIVLLLEEYPNKVNECKELGLTRSQTIEVLKKTFTKEELIMIKENILQTDSKSSNNNKPYTIWQRSSDIQCLQGALTINTIHNVRKDHREIYDALCDLSTRKVIWLGRNGYGGTKLFFREQKNQGTMAIIKKAKEEFELPDIQVDILENLMLEGMKFASYDSLFEFLDEKRKETILKSD
jgi:hypothetical protein